MGKLGKQLFKQFVEFECERQLLWLLGRGDGRWIDPLRAPVPKDTRNVRPEVAAALGKVYEQRVYGSLRHLTEAQFALDPMNQVIETTLDAELARELVDEVRADGAAVLLEHQWEMAEGFLAEIFQVGEGEVPLQRWTQMMRPDLILLSSDDSEATRALRPGGRVEALGAGHGKVRLSLIDIKHTSEQGVGKRQFVELLFYAHALSHWLAHHGLEDVLFVGLDEHGIFPQLDLHDAFITSVASLRSCAVGLVWEESAHIFDFACERIRELWSGAPHRPEAVPVNIQAACGRCDFLEDCKRSLGMSAGGVSAGGSASSWDLRLLPYTSRGISEQLRRRGFQTVGDVASGIDALKLGDTPEPLYPERPLLKLKAEALSKGRDVFPDPQGAVDQRHLAMTLPRHTDLALTFDVEMDPTNGVVFGAAFDLVASVASASPLASAHNAWWAAWRAALSKGRAPDAADLALVEGALDRAALDDALDGMPPEKRQAHIQRLLREVGESLWALHEESLGTLEIFEVGETCRGYELPTARMFFQYADVNMDLEPIHEQNLAARMVTVLYHMLRVCGGAEELVVALGAYGSVGTSFGGFYWSMEQLNNIQDMLERHLLFLVNDPSVRERFASLVMWLTPSDSGVAHFLQHKKLFNLRSFVETCVGLPHVINYTWHEIAEARHGYRFKRRFWPRHFNYMDFSVWHDYLQESNPMDRGQLVAEIIEELKKKVGMISRLRRDYQRSGREVVSGRMKRPVDMARQSKGMPDAQMHALARFWCLFARLTGSAQQWEAELARSNYPAWSVGKLAAGIAEQLSVTSEDQLSGTFDFLMRGMSSNMKISEGSHVFLIPESRRDLHPYALEKRWKVSVEAMRWDPTQRGYRVRAAFGGGWGNDAHPWFEMTAQARQAEAWFVYPQAGDFWSGRLFQNKDNLLKRQSLGVSWLGGRLATRWGVGGGVSLAPPKSLTFGLPEVYLYAPELLPTPSAPPAPRFRVSPEPDDSQKAAITQALQGPLACIQGPPGTGKSQTIAALIDAFLAGRSGPARVLVTAFSYSAMTVVLDKVRKSRAQGGGPSAAAQTQTVFMRSASRDPLPPQPGLRDVDDLTASPRAIKLNGARLSLRGKRLEDYLDERFILFANAHSLYNLATPSKSKNHQYNFLHNDFGFDLIIVDEASQVPTDHFLAAASLVHPGQVTLRFKRRVPEGPIRDVRLLERMAVESAPDAESLTRVVIVGDHNQLPPVQPVKPPENLRAFLGSLFSYYVEGHQVPSTQLRVNYRSRKVIVDYTDRLNLYEALQTHRDQLPPAPLPPSPRDAPGWVTHLLEDARTVSTVIHDRRFETAVSPLEATLTAELVLGFYRQMKVSSPDEERHFWAEHLGIVSPHNAHGRLIARQLFDRLTAGGGAGPRTTLSPDALMESLRHTIYSVEKFQGSDRTCIIGSVGISSRDQLAAEEAFIYDLNRFNVLTSRAKDKIVLICSRNYLDYIPRDRDVMGYAARVRDFAEVFCDQRQPMTVTNEAGDPEEVTLRWR